MARDPPAAGRASASARRRRQSSSTAGDRLVRARYQVDADGRGATQARRRGRQSRVVATLASVRGSAPTWPHGARRAHRDARPWRPGAPAARPSRRGRPRPSAGSGARRPARARPARATSSSAARRPGRSARPRRSPGPRSGRRVPVPASRRDAGRTTMPPQHSPAASSARRLLRLQRVDRARRRCRHAELRPRCLPVSA